ADGAAAIPPGLESARRAYAAFVRFAERFGRVTGGAFHALKAPGVANRERPFRRHEFSDLLARFHEHMEDDFNTGGAIGVLFELVTALNRLAHAPRPGGPARGRPAR